MPVLLCLWSCYSNSRLIRNDNILPPELIEKPFFQYPRYAQENNLSGKVHLILNLDANGNIDSVYIDKSSGYDILDKSAAAFVKKFKFTPALKDGKPINIYVGYTVDYTLTENNTDAIQYVKKIRELMNKSEKAFPEKRAKLGKEMLVLHDTFIKSHTDFLNYNMYIGKIIDADLYKNWAEHGAQWPLHFLVFHDFQESYQDSELNNLARDYMFEYLKKDIIYADDLANREPALITEKEKYNQQIRDFLKEYYAGMLPDTLSYFLE